MEEPRAIRWFRALSVWLALANVALAFCGFELSRFTPGADLADLTDWRILHTLGATLVPLGLVFAVVNVLCAFVPRKPWFWPLALTNIVGGVVFCLPALLLVKPWYSPEVKRYFDPEGKYHA